MIDALAAAHGHGAGALRFLGRVAAPAFVACFRGPSGKVSEPLPRAGRVAFHERLRPLDTQQVGAHPRPPVHNVTKAPLRRLQVQGRQQEGLRIDDALGRVRGIQDIRAELGPLMPGRVNARTAGACSNFMFDGE
jgi:hypothetical protein